jgi:hypothetical protein
MGLKLGGSKTKQQSSFSSAPTYNDPRAQVAIDALASGAKGQTKYGDTLGNFFQSRMAGGVNPYVQGIVDSNNQLANTDFANRIAQVRSGGFRGGIGTDLVNQGMFTSDFTSRQHGANSQLLANAFDTGENRALAAAGGLGGLDQNSLQSAIALIAALRGEAGEGQQTQKQSGWGFDLNSFLKGLGSFGGTGSSPA